MKDQAAAIAERWEQTFLGDVVTLHYGKALAKDDRNPSGGVAVYGANGIKDRADVALTEGPSLIIGRKGSAGEVTRVDGPFWPLDVTYYTSHDESRIDFGFLQYALSVMDLPSLARGVKPGINRNDVYSLPIPLPPLEEQKRIVAVLDQAFAALDRARAHAQANLADAEALYASSMAKALASFKSTKSSKLSELTQFITDGTHQTPKYFESGHVFLSSKNVRDGRIDWDDVKYIDTAQHHQMQKRLSPIKNDILLRKNGAGYGKAAIVDSDVLFDVYVSLAVLRPNGKVKPELMLKLINSSSTMRQFENRIKGQGVPNLHLQEIKEVILQFPESPSDQEALSDRLSKLSETVRLLEAHYRRKIIELNNLRTSLLQKAFSGQLTA